jgi:hypothetical protein
MKAIARISAARLARSARHEVLQGAHAGVGRTLDLDQASGVLAAVR